MSSEDLISSIKNRETLSYQDSYELLSSLLTEENTSEQFAEYLSAIHSRGETYEGLRALVEFTKERSELIDINVGNKTVIDVSGTGGSSIKTINVSTITALALASLGYVVPKQSNYAGTGITGSADIFQALGIDIAEIDGVKLKKTLEEVGICPYFTPMLSEPLRDALDVVANYYTTNKSPVKSIFHLAAFIHSPVGMSHRVYGCYSKDHLEMISKLLDENDYKKTAVLHGHGGLPEISTFGKTTIIWRIENSAREEVVEPKDFGLKSSEVGDIESLDVEGNISLFLRVVYGDETGPYRDICLANVAVALVLLGNAVNLREGTDIARSAFEKGLVKDKLEELVKSIGSEEKLKGLLI